MTAFSSTALSVIVGTLICVVTYKFSARQRELQADNQLAAANGCLLPEKWNSTWPLGLDLLVKAFHYDRRQQILKFFLDVVDTSGTTFEQNLLFARGIDTIDPQNIQALLSTQFTSQLRTRTAIANILPLMGSGIFTQDGAQWRHSRELLHPQFMTNWFTNFEQIYNTVDNLISSIPDNSVVDLQPLFFHLTFKTTLFLLFGQYLPSLKSEGITGQESDFANTYNIGQDYLAKHGQLVHSICHEFVDCANSATKTGTYTFINALIKETQNPEVLQDQCLNILLAGRDTTYPHVLSKLQAEIRDTVRVGPRHSLSLPCHQRRYFYLKLQIQSHYPNLANLPVLRLYPSVPVNSRAATKTTTLPTGGGPTGTAPILVRKGEAVGYCVYAMHRHRDIYGTNADEFRPERWENNALKDVGWGYLPFNRGPRICLGQEFVLLEAGYTIVRLLQTFEVIEQAEGCRMEERIGEERQVLTLVVSCGKGCVVRMRRYGEM
ncbi:cytochrome P450 [Aspergillus tetrazonus]